MKKYNLINNSLGWLMFLVAAVTYLLTMEPTASFWDCGEFTAQGYKLEVGHPPGNPIYMLAARFFANFASSPSTVSVCVNTMSALLSAGTILLLFWTITHLVKRLIVKDEEDTISWQKMAVIMGSGVVGALAYTWSDTFWFSAAEAEVYAFSSFCTALTFWLILKWESRCDNPNSDRYLIAIAYTIGVSVAVHLLNLLCIPAIVLVIYYRKFKNTNAKGSLIALAVSFVIVGLILFGLVPGFVEIAQYFELLFVNDLGFCFNSGVIVYTAILTGILVWAIYEMAKGKSQARMKFSFLLAITASGMLFIGDGVTIAVILIVALAVYLFKFCKVVPQRVFYNIVMSVAVIFFGYSSYALILIRSNAQTPMDQNSPDNVFSLADYLNREQYGKTPLLYGPVYNSSILYTIAEDGQTQVPVKKYGKPIYRKEVKQTADAPDRYIQTGFVEDYEMTPEMNMIFPRLYASGAARNYNSWLGSVKTKPVEATILVDREGNPYHTEQKQMPTFGENLRYFFSYQLNYMYWRYFMWNFAGRQNDIQGQGEITHGNWITGISFIDNARLGDQSLLPEDLGSGNAGHNVYFMLPLILGIIGLLWQAYTSKRGIEQFWVVFFLFFMTGIAIVLYLNQTPSQPRERDYAFAGSFYAFAIWIGMGVAGLCRMLLAARKKMTEGKKVDADKELKINNGLVIAAVALGIIVPFQMVSQTWDDHDRSGRYACRDFGMNYLSSVGENGIIFTNGDNDTFPLWYAQEVEGWRTDVRVVNLSYLSTDWYINQMRRPAYESAALKMIAPKDAFAYDRRQFNYFIDVDTTMLVPADKSLREIYSDNSNKNAWGLWSCKYPMMYANIDKDAVIKNGIADASKAAIIADSLSLNLLEDRYTVDDGGITSSKVAAIDIISSIVNDGWNRPIYFAMTVPESYYLGLMPYMASTGMAYEVTPIRYGYNGSEITVDTDKAFENVTKKYKWGGLDKATANNKIYCDETVRRMVTTTRSSMVDLAFQLLIEGLQAKAIMAGEYTEGGKPLDKNSEEYKESEKYMNDRFSRSRHILELMSEKLPESNQPYSVQLGEKIAQIYYNLGQETGNKADTQKANDLMKAEINRFGQYVRYYQTLTPSQYNLLSNTDMYIDTYYMVELLQLFNEYNSEEDTHKVLKELETCGVNVNRLFERYPRK